MCEASLLNELPNKLPTEPRGLKNINLGFVAIPTLLRFMATWLGFSATLTSATLALGFSAALRLLLGLRLLTQGSSATVGLSSGVGESTLRVPNVRSGDTEGTVQGEVGSSPG